MLINELFYLRAIACSAVVLLHTISSSMRFFNLSIETELILNSIQLLLLFGTPTFVVISELVLSYSYPDKLPTNFFKKRINFILIPFIVMGIFYAWFDMWHSSDVQSLKVFLLNSISNVFLGSYHGYFVLIIFQFYILHIVFQKYIVDRFSVRFVIGCSLVINFVYLAIFNGTRMPDTSILFYFWEDKYKLPFLGWIFYFSVAFYCGKNFNLMKSKINKHIGKLTVFVFLCGSFLLFNYHFIGFRSINSKRVDMVFYTLAVICISVYIVSKIKKIPPFIMLLSRYSFGIYLLHPFILSLIERYGVFPESNLSFYIVMSFILSLTGSIVIVHLLNKIPVGKYIIGNVKSSKEIFKKTNKQAA
ncbi:acyltransferase family protein [Bacillus sp. ISL-4]|uniref:acyltransferase family protein n=1 Tax=Bacillus sp. ISL-4 TaxID=2819125 RepID=UPI001BE5AC71|nr:acyltransferase family protein [Bacillus sp. ISL-4]MBT2667501.1 acyltransferase family protein [Bacillus sp. ISL-4]MBT2672960.1 acyltransferase family protein [Streptomyces sp. ISL-14]